MKRILQILLGLTVMCSLQGVYAQNVEYVGSYDTPGTAEAVFVSGDYAYVADGGSGLLIVDVSDPFNPAPAGSLQTYFWALDVYVSETYAYVCMGTCAWSWCFGGLMIVDVSDPTAPDSIGGIQTSYANDITVSDDYAYFVVTAGPFGSDAFTIMDISEPDSIVLANTIGPHCGDNPGLSAEFVYGDNAYVDCSGVEFSIWNVSDPYNPFELGYCWLPAYIHGIFVVNEYAYVADYFAGLQVVSVTDSTNPIPIGGCDTPGPALEIFVSAQYAYVADGDSGLQIINVSDPYSPALTGGYDTPGNARGVYVQDDFIYVADTSSLMILRFNPQTGIEEIGDLPRQFSLNQNYPNPFNASTRIDFDIPALSEVDISVYDVLGRPVATLFEGRKQPGSYSINWKAEDVPSGIYFARLRAGSWTESIRMTLLK